VGNYSVIYDACVLYPAPLRDLLMYLALTGLYKARWSDAIHDEWMRNVLARRPDLKPWQLDRTRQLMDSHVQDAIVTGYESIIDRLTLPDLDDRHVFAAAIHSRSDAIITFNLKDFPVDVLAEYNVEAIHPDDFVRYQIDLDESAVCKAINRLRKGLKNPPKKPDEYLAILQKQGLPQTAAIFILRIPGR
jgi:hypothetical protein